MDKITLIELNEQNNKEKIGTTKVSEMSAIVDFIQRGASLLNVIDFKIQVDSLSATLWAMLVLSLKTEHGDKDAEIILKKQQEQVPKILNHIQKIIYEWTECEKNAIKEKANEGNL